MSRTDTTWMDRGACRGTPPDTFFPTRGEDVAAVKGLCAACTVRTDCLRYALDNHEEYGVWGGCSERERRLIWSQMAAGANQDAAIDTVKRRTRKPRPDKLEHGTEIAYQSCRRRPSGACETCTDAHHAHKDATVARRRRRVAA